MSRVVHSTELELRSQLQDATDLDMIISVHTSYINRIFDRFVNRSSALTDLGGPRPAVRTTRDFWGLSH